MLAPTPMPAPEPQAILTPLTEAAIFLTVTIDPNGEALVRELLEDVSGLRRSVGFRIPEAELTCVVGIGRSAWDRLFGIAASGRTCTVRGDPGCASRRPVDRG